ncbi:hypothetical protein FVR03_17375 [Pontibacter qinzhouensis]|uniref:Uncharacterized protein n=1 Tax=Pontibacter qinzhouensis TaxID=2603253 RepID=A0A5C8JI26_9BACT|nr:hypothetical protein FVR03_17375 [Pontibacter qinzhouensis]
MLPPRRERPQPKGFHKVVFYFTLIMTLIYIAAGFFLIFADVRQYNLGLPENMKIILGGVLILYGIIRFVRVYQKNSQKRHDKFRD